MAASKDRRRSSRWWLEPPVQCRIYDVTMGNRLLQDQVSGELLDLSRGGCCLLLYQELPAYIDVTFRLEFILHDQRFVRRGTIQWVQFRRWSYTICGIQFQYQTPEDEARLIKAIYATRGRLLLQ